MGLFDGVDLSNWGSSNFQMPGQQQPPQNNTSQGASGQPADYGSNTPIANTSQGMNAGGFGNFGGNLSSLAGNGGDVSQAGQDRLQHLQNTMGAFGGMSPNLPPPGGMGQQAQPIGGAAPGAGQPGRAWEWFDDPKNQDAMVQKLGNQAPSFVANPQSQQDYLDRYYYLAHNGQNAGTSYNQAGENIGLRPNTALADGSRDYAHPDQIGYQQFQKNVYGSAGANRQFNELAGPIGADSAALKQGWQLATPQGTPDQGKALALAYTLGEKNPGVDYSVVQTADGWNIAARPQDYHPNLPQPGMVGGGAPRYSGGGGGGGGGYAPRPAYQQNYGGANATQHAAAQQTPPPGFMDTVANIGRNIFQPAAQQVQHPNLPAPGRPAPNLAQILAAAKAASDGAARARQQEAARQQGAAYNQALQENNAYYGY